MRILFLNLLAFCLIACATSESKTSGDLSLDAPAQNVLRLLSYNVRNGIGMDNTVNFERTANLIAGLNPAIVAVQELDSVTQRSKGVDVLNELSKLAKMHHAYNPSIDYDGGKYGLGVLSKDKILSTHKVSLPGREEVRSALFVELDKYVFCCTHLSLTEEDRISSIAILTQEAQNFTKPVFLAGDLNDVPNSITIEKLKESWTILNNTELFSFSSSNPHECIDYIAVLGHPNITVKQTGVIADTITSDHRPVYVDIVF